MKPQLDDEREIELSTLPLPDVRGEMAASTFREAARMLGPVAAVVRLEATSEGFRFVGVDSEGADAGELFLSADALGRYEVRQAGVCILDVGRLADFARIPRRKQLVSFHLGGDAPELRFVVGFLSRTMAVRQATGRRSLSPARQTEGRCWLCGGSGILDTHRHSYPCPECAPDRGSAA